MKIHGLQKMTLLDFPGKVACTVFLGGCDFRCPFCHNSALLDMNAPAEMDDEELLAFLKKRVGLLEGVAFTGGEPLLRRDLPDLLVRIKELGYPVKMDTNGNHPSLLKELVNDGLVDYVAMDIKNSPERYAETIGLEAFDISKVDESRAFLIEQKKIDFEFRTTVINEFHNKDSFRAIGPWIHGAQKYYLQKFEDRDTVPFAGLTSPSEEALNTYKEIVTPYVGLVELRGV